MCRAIVCNLQGFTFHVNIGQKLAKILRIGQIWLSFDLGFYRWLGNASLQRDDFFSKESTIFKKWNFGDWGWHMGRV